MERSTQTIRSAPCSRHPATAPSPTIPAPKTTQVLPGSTAAVLIAAPRPVESPQAKRQACSKGASGLTFARAISGITVYSAKVEQPMKWRISLAIARDPGGAVGKEAQVLLLADRHAEVGPRVDAVDALAALGREEGDDVVARRPASRPPAPTRSTTPAPSWPSTVGA